MQHLQLQAMNDAQQEDVLNPEDFYDDNFQTKESLHKELTEDEKNKINELFGNLLNAGFEHKKTLPANESPFGYNYSYTLKPHELEKGSNNGYKQPSSMDGKLYFVKKLKNYSKVEIRVDGKNPSILHIDKSSLGESNLQKFNLVKDYDKIVKEIDRYR